MDECEHDGKTSTFKLRKNLRWSDGEPLTADDVVFTWAAIYDTNIINPTRDLFIINEKQFVITKIDDLTVQVVTPEIYAPFSGEFWRRADSAQAYSGRNAGRRILRLGLRRELGSGQNRRQRSVPFEKIFSRAQSLLLERNPYFFEVDSNNQRLPYFDNIIYTIVPGF